MADKREYDSGVVKQFIKEKRFKELALYMKEHNLELQHNHLVSRERDYLENNQQLKDLSQYVKKIALNSSYGATLNSTCASYDFRLGASTTLSGRLVTKHMAEEINYNTIKKRIHKGGTLIGGDTDSLKYDTVIIVKDVDGKTYCAPIGLYFIGMCDDYNLDEKTDKEYGYPFDQILGFDDNSGKLSFFDIKYVCRHGVSKGKWEIEDQNGNIVTVTEDHSCMVERDGKLVAVKPREITPTDLLITNAGEIAPLKAKVKRCECVGSFDNEYVYDIGVEDDRCQWFFGNNILVHNSNYFSIGEQCFKDANPDFVYTKQNVVDYINNLTKIVDKSFFQAVKDRFHVDDEHADIMHCAREIIGQYGLYVKKKRYAIMVYEDEGHRRDVDGKPGKLKIRGLQTQRADMPKAVKKLLKDMLVKVLTGGTEKDLQQMILEFTKTAWDVEPWKKGTPKPVNKLNQYMEKLKEGCDGMTAMKTTIPSQVRGAINWNNLIDYYGDTQTKKFAGGEKCLMCKLLPNNMLKMDVVCIPIDIDPTTIPQWFKDLPFDVERTDEAVINTTIDSIFGILGWNLHLSALTENQNDDIELEDVIQL